ncbi:hypothetical protein KKB40_06245 [Patescibacteria group bacterium]|nr:hypothetical protein [Patescibacteria group bacterium]
MNKRDIIIGLVILVALAGVVFWRQKDTDEQLTVPQTLSIEDKIEEVFNIQFPKDIDRAELRDVSGRDSSAIAVREIKNDQFEYSVLADLPEPLEGQIYQSWIRRGQEGDEGYSLVSTGVMRMAKGGWMVNFKSPTDYFDHDRVIVSLEKTLDNQMEEQILEGFF